MSRGKRVARRRNPRTVLSSLATHDRVEFVDDERSIGNGVLVTLKQGWTWDALQDNRVRGFDMPMEALRAVGVEAIAFAGPYTD